MAGPSLTHGGQNCMRGIEGSIEICIDERIPYFRSEPLHRPILSIGPAGEDQDIDPPEFFQRYLRQLLHIFYAGGVSTPHSNVALFSCQFLLERLQPVFAPRSCHDFRPLPREEHRRSTAPTPRSTNNYDHLAA